MATEHDVEGISNLIADSARVLLQDVYAAGQIEAAIGTVFAVDRQLIRDGTYYVVVDAPHAERAPAAPGAAAAASDHGGHEVLACGGWSRRRALFGGDAHRGAEDTLIDPATEPARIRAFFVHPQHARRGLGSLIMTACESAIAAAGFSRVEIMATLAGELLYQQFGYAVVQRTEIDLGRGLSLPVCRMQRTGRADESNGC